MIHRQSISLCGRRKQLVAGTREFSLSAAMSAESRVGLRRDMRAARSVEASPSVDLDPTSHVVLSQMIIVEQLGLLSQERCLGSRQNKRIGEFFWSYKHVAHGTI